MEKRCGHWYLYILQCTDGSLYTGITNNLTKRIESHRAGNGSRYVRSRLPVTLAAYWKFHTTKGDILRLEKQIKSLTSGKKQALVKNPNRMREYCEDSKGLRYKV